MKFEEIIYYERKEAAEEAAKEAAKEADRRRRLEDIRELLEDYGEVPKELAERMEKEASDMVLKNWHKLAARSKNMEEFIMNIDKI